MRWDSVDYRGVDYRGAAFRSIAVGVLLATCGGCGSDIPFDFVPVQGKITYEDGSLIDADRILVGFNPVDFERDGPKVPPPGQTNVNVADGTFDAVSSYRANDGVFLGKHKVTVVAFKGKREGMPAPSNAVPVKYRSVSTTPLEIEVTSSGQVIELKVTKS